MVFRNLKKFTDFGVSLLDLEYVCGRRHIVTGVSDVRSILDYALEVRVAKMLKVCGDCFTLGS